MLERSGWMFRNLMGYSRCDSLAGITSSFIRSPTMCLLRSRF